MGAEDHKPTKVVESMRTKLEEIKELDAKIESLHESRKLLLSEWAAEACPYAVGDIVEVRGYSHIGKKCRIDRVGWTHGYSEGYQWKVIGTLILKDGSLGKITVDWTECQAKENYEQTKRRRPQLGCSE